MSEPNQPAPRRRFVIPFTGKPKPGAGPPPIGGAAPPKKSRGGGCLKIFGVLVVLALLFFVAAGIGGYFYWRNYQTQPAYALALMFDAAFRTDQKSFDDVVDTDKVSDALADQVTEKALARYAGDLPDAVRERIKAAVLAFVPTIKQKAHDELMGEVAAKGERLKGYPFFVMALAVPRVISIKPDGDMAKIVAPPEAGSTEMTMQRNGDHWKVVAIKDDAAVDRILSAIAGDLPVPDILKGKLPSKIPKLPPNLPKIPGLN